jgi:hypothetical protein
MTMLTDAFIFDTDTIPPSAEVQAYAEKAASSNAPALDWPLWARVCVVLGGVLLLLSGVGILGIGLAMEAGLL